jgi:hypothetical protein
MGMLYLLGKPIEANEKEKKCADTNDIGTHVHYKLRLP